MVTTMASDPRPPRPRVGVITSVQRRRRWTTAEKVRLVEETMQPGMSASLLARRAGIAPSQPGAWKRRMLEGGFRAVQADEDVVATSRVRELEKRVHALERLLGRKTMEVEILKEALDAARPKKPMSQPVSWSDREDGSRWAWSPPRLRSPAPTWSSGPVALESREALMPRPVTPLSWSSSARPSISGPATATGASRLW